MGSYAARLGLLALLLTSAPGWSQTPPAPNLPTPDLPPAHQPERLYGEKLLATIRIPQRPVSPPVVLSVSPTGSDTGDGSPAHPFATLARAQAAVRDLNRDRDVVVRLAAGVYRLAEPLRFSAADGGQAGHLVRWEAADGAKPVISGGDTVTGWRLADPAKGIWAADIPRGVDPRQIWVNDRLARRATLEVPRQAFRFHDWGMEIVDPAWRGLADVPDQKRIEVEGTGWFTDRHAMVERIEGDRIVMQQPGWRNNIIGYDTIARPVSEASARLFLVNALAFLREPGQWYADPAAGRLYYKPRAGEDLGTASVVLPRLSLLVSIAGTYDTPVKDLQFKGLSFQHTSWLEPSGPQGYASQQSGAFLAGHLSDYPPEPIRDCSWGCWAFEAARNHWRQQPAAIQVAAATRILFEGDEFTHLGQVALGIGNNADANDSGIGLGAVAIEVSGNLFTDLSGGAIMAGGVTPDAHHPPRPDVAVRDILIRNNRIRTVSQDYREQAAILVTYATAPVILHNDVSDTPYDGIDVGWGWGVNDPGGSSAYRSRERGYYDQPGNLAYDTPTILRDAVIFGNRVHSVKQWYGDGGAIYHLSADPGGLIAENYIYDVPGGIGIYLDEGSRYLTVRNNVVDRVDVWLNVNTLDFNLPRRTAMDDLALGNWYRDGRARGTLTDYLNNRLVDTVEVKGDTWPAGARAVMERSGIQRDEAPRR
ncbi:right-handed parallel beta-helix repeat-containing protein [Nitrospirillum iridis]|uniref:Right-handed parallel beta-helix repeat-containing protein n=1 Tax=Nitrospirillum iridis TaxID=765888 RepID=A0A7X0B0J9_9PROT|nr:right-handed parallel beta-helix repeat-containing protein [Nitrospirillum iridis]MBB6253127.1 hypothetical protein [Nitrospirillum iridis]